ncbi:YciI family protein [Niveibacterium sp. SC-1]|uniref:YciI family protein n=1 Tax=Niveibacterium sp. SC-1 TaxID=3135646 RepID=UPI00311F8F02
MKYMCLIYIDEELYSALPAETRKRCEIESIAYDETLRKSGHYCTSDALASARMATSLRHENGRFSPTDGPYAETKEQVAGFVMIDAKDLDEALRIAEKFPGARFGGVEVRPVIQIG